MRQRLMPAFAMVFLMMLTPLSGCFGENEVKSLDTDSLSVSESDSLQAGMWQTITLQASDDLACFHSILYPRPRFYACTKWNSS